jgi:hypothetical protein
VGRSGAPVVQSFVQPFHLPLARIRAYLGALGSSLSAIAGVFAPPISSIVAAQKFASTVPAQAELGLSADELTIVTTPSTQLVELSTIYGISFTETGSTIVQMGVAAGAPGIDASVLGPAMGLSRADLGGTVATSFVSAGGANVTIVAAERGPDSVQNDIEWAKGLTIDALDRMHRFTRVVRKTGWAVGDLDVVLTALLDTTLGVTGVQNVAQLHAIQAQFGLSIGELCSLIGAIPGVTPQTPAGTSFFDSLFNQSPHAAGNNLLPVLPAGAQSYTLPSGIQSNPVPAGTQSTASGLSMTARLLTGLAVKLADLGALVNQLSTPLAMTNGGFLMSAANLTLLYRHARLARLLGMGINQLFQLFSLLGIQFIDTPQAPALAGKMPASLANLLSVFDFWSWQQQSGYSLDDIAVATGGTPLAPAAYPNPLVVATQVVAAAAKALTFTDTVFSVALGIPEQGSLDLLTSLAAGAGPLVAQSPNDGSWSLVAGVDFSNVSPTSIVSIPIPATATVPVPASGNTPATPRLVTGAAVLQALQAYVAPGTTFTDTAFASALKLTSTVGADDLLASLTAMSPPLVQKSGASWSLAAGANVNAAGLVAIGIPPTATLSTPATPTTPASTSLVTGAQSSAHSSRICLRRCSPGVWRLRSASRPTSSCLSRRSRPVAQCNGGVPGGQRGGTAVGIAQPRRTDRARLGAGPARRRVRSRGVELSAPPSAGTSPQSPPPWNPIDFVRLNSQVFGTGPLRFRTCKASPRLRGSGRRPASVSTSSARCRRMRRSPKQWRAHQRGPLRPFPTCRPSCLRTMQLRPAGFPGPQRSGHRAAPRRPDERRHRPPRENPAVCDARFRARPDKRRLTARSHPRHRRPDAGQSRHRPRPAPLD